MSYSSDNNRKAEASRLFADLPKKYINSIVKGKIELLCIDFGHGESTIARMQIKNDANGRKKYTVVPLNTSEGNPTYKHPTYLYVPRDGQTDRVTIGETAYSRAQSGMAGDFYCDFKRMPSRADDYAKSSTGQATCGRRMTYRQLMRTYVQAYLDMISLEPIMKLNDMHENTPVLLMIGRPSGSKWDAEEQAYKEIFSDLKVCGQTPIDVFVVSESFAALAQSVNDSESINYKFEETVVCIDMGSSTADITCMCRGEVLYEYGISLGAHIIEANLLDYVVSEASRKYEEPYTAKDIVDGYNMALPLFRVYKENFFGDATKDPLLNAKMRLDVDNGSGEETVTVRLSGEVMDRVCKSTPIHFKDKNAPNGVSSYDSWYDGCRAFFAKACGDIYDLVDSGRLSAVKSVIVTGGASRMGFVRDLVEAEFGKPHERGRHNHEKFFIYHSIEPSYTVSKGLTWISYNAARTEQILGEVKEKLPEMIGANCSEDIYFGICEQIAPMVYSKVKSEIHMWASRNAYESINDFLAHVVDPGCNAMLSSERMRKSIGDCIVSWYDNGGVNTSLIMEQVTGELSKMFEVSLDKINFSLPDDIVQQAAGEASRVNISLESSPLVKSAISLFFFLDWFYDMDKKDYPQSNRQTYANRWSERQIGITNDIQTNLLNQFLADDKVKRCIEDYLCRVMGRAIDERINSISMYCFDVKNRK